jgi:hypothetical protein
MSTAVLIERRLLPSAVAATTLKAAARFWVAMVVIGQLIFAFTVASFYGRAAVRDLQVWNRFMTHGYIPGDRAGNLAVVIHLVSLSSLTSPVRFNSFRKSGTEHRPFIGGTGVSTS